MPSYDLWGNLLDDDEESTPSDTPKNDDGEGVYSYYGNRLPLISNGYVEEGVAYFTNGEDVIFTLTGIGGGGGGGGGNNAVLTVQNTSGWISKTISFGDSVNISFNWSSIENDIPTGAGTLTIKVNGATKLSRTIQQGPNDIDATNLLSTGTNVIRLSIADIYGNTKNLALTVNVIQLVIRSSFIDTIVYTSSFNFEYVASGDGVKTVYFKVDGATVGVDTITTSDVQQTFMIPAQSHGEHTLECYFETDISGELVESNHLKYAFIFAQSGNTDVIIASVLSDISAKQYETIQIPYTAYDPESLTTDIQLEVNGTIISTQNVDRTKQVWSYRCDTQGNFTLSISSRTTTKNFNLVVSASSADIQPVTNDLDLYLTSKGRSNNEFDPAEWVYEDISVEFTNFNFVSDGWLSDDDGNTVLRITGDARLTIPYKIFGENFTSTGKTIEFEFATRAVRDYDTEIISCMQNNRGMAVTPQRVILKSEQSEISAQYKENEHVRVSFVIEKEEKHRFIYCFINGIISRIIQYPEKDNFWQQSPVDITIGSNSAVIDIYNIRVYHNDLTRQQMLKNWIADTQNVDLMLERYERNDVYDASRIVVAKLPKDLPYMILEGPELPQSKGDKKTINGSFVDPLDSTRSFTFTKAQIDVQGTSSQFYPRKNYKVKFKNGFEINGEHADDYAMRSDSIPTNTFTFKADVASSEGANNVELVRLYEQACPYRTPAQQRDSRVRQGIDGFPMVIFWDNGSKTVFLGKYNFNNDKGTEEVFGFTDGDESWEILNNNSDYVIWENDDYTGTAWQKDFEARYPDTDPAYTDVTQLSAMAAWIKSTKGNPTKFKQELAQHMEVDSVLFYYLFTELFLMVDSRAKNAFPSFIGGDI